MPQNVICDFQENFQSIYSKHYKKMGKNWIKGVSEALKVKFCSLNSFTIFDFSIIF